MEQPKSLTPRVDSLAVGTLVLGVLSFCLPVVCTIPALVLGTISINAIRQSHGLVRGTGFAIAGMALSLIGPLLAFCIGLGVYFSPSVKAKVSGESTDWIVVFRSADPTIWDTDVNRGADHFARQLSTVPADIRYLRMRQGDDYVIIELSKDDLHAHTNYGRYGWEGSNGFQYQAHHLGIYDRERPRGNLGDINIHNDDEWERGWGFGNRCMIDDRQGYSWNGRVLPPTVFEIAVKRGVLTPAETQKLLRGGTRRPN